MKAKKWGEIDAERMNPLIVRQALHTSNMTIARIGLAKGAIVPLHQHTNEQITMLESGRLRFVLGDEEVVINGGDLLEIPPGVPHQVEALEDSLATDLFAPRREDWIRGDDAYLRR